MLKNCIAQYKNGTTETVSMPYQAMNSGIIEVFKSINTMEQYKRTSPDAIAGFQIVLKFNGHYQDNLPIFEEI